jgi:limonene-1,2-epoxide hydrolase/ketosteroid isomerase-like protein
VPWFPEFVGAVELARRQTRAAGRADPVRQYFTALTEGDARLLEAVWPGEVVVYDPRAGEVRGHRALRRFIRRNVSWLADRRARTEIVATTSADGRAVVELLAHLAGDAPSVAWPVAVVAESPDELSVVFRTYCSQWPVDGRRHVRPAILEAGAPAPADIVGRFEAAMDAGDADAIVETFTPDGYYQEALGVRPVHRGADALRSFFADRFRAGGIGVEHCVVTDDAVRCAVECNYVRWGRDDVVPQAALGVYERGADGLLTATRVYDDIEPPADE